MRTEKGLPLCTLVLWDTPATSRPVVAFNLRIVDDGVCRSHGSLLEEMSWRTNRIQSLTNDRIFNVNLRTTLQAANWANATRSVDFLALLAL